MPTIAGVVLTLNEEKDLARALLSLDWCDELLVVDSGSKDQTQNVAENCGARFVRHCQTPPFLITEQRNWALDNAGLRSEWVLFLDADEEVRDELAARIKSCIASTDLTDAYELTPRYWFLGKWLKRTQGYPNWHPRLVRRGSARFHGGVWESFPLGTRVKRITTPYEHYAFSKGLDDWLHRHMRYAEWDSNEILQFLDTKDSQRLMTARARNRRIASASIWPIKPLLRFVQKYILQGGFIEGWQGLLFSLMMTWFDLMVVIKILEKRRKSKGLSL